MEKVKSALTLLKSGQLDLERFLMLVTEIITKEIGSTRASIWAFNVASDRIECLDLFDVRQGGKHAKGAVLKEEDFPEYFAAIKANNVVRAPRAGENPDTKCFEELYFAPNDIYSLLDFVIISRSKYVGVLCCENCGDYKEWTDKDVDFLQQLAFAVGFAIGISPPKGDTRAA